MLPLDGVTLVGLDVEAIESEEVTGVVTGVVGVCVLATSASASILSLFSTKVTSPSPSMVKKENINHLS